MKITECECVCHVEPTDAPCLECPCLANEIVEEWLR